MHKQCIRAALLAAVCVLWAGQALARGMVTLVFDDGHASVYEKALPILESHGFTAVTAVISENLRWPHKGYMTKEQAQDLQKRGWEIASHSVHHIGPFQIPLRLSEEDFTLKAVKIKGRTVYQAAYPFSDVVSVFLNDYPLAETGSMDELLTTGGAYCFDAKARTLTVLPRLDTGNKELTVQVGSYERELRDSKAELEGHGLKVTAFVAPFSQFPEVAEELSIPYYQVAASLGDGVNEPACGKGVLNPDAFDMHDIERHGVWSRTTAEKLIELVDDHAVKQSSWVVFCLHGLDGEGWEPLRSEELAKFADWLQKHRVRVVGLTQGAFLLRMGRNNY